MKLSGDMRRRCCCVRELDGGQASACASDVPAFQARSEEQSDDSRPIKEAVRDE
jgi:hypothetical protein